MTSIFKPTESSAIVSLQELMALEEQRLRQEDEARQQKAAAARREAQEREEQRQREQAAQLAAERQEQEERQRREREHQAHLEALRQGLIEQERIKAERQAQQAEEALRMENEQALARIHQQSAARKLRRALVGVSLGAVAVIAGGLGLYFGKIRPESDLRAAAASQEARDAQTARDAAERDRADTQQRIEQLQVELSKALTDAERAHIQQQITNASRPRPVTPTTRTVRTVEPGVQAGGTPCPKGDPICGLEKTGR